MKTILAILSCFFFSLSGKAQKHDTLIAQHITIIKNPQTIIMPEIINVDFCQKLYALSISDSIKFVDEDKQKLYYHLSIEIFFSKGGEVLSIRPRGNISAISEVADNVISLLRRSEWKVKTSQKNREFIFECILQDGKFKDVILKTPNNYQRKNICK